MFDVSHMGEIETRGPDARGSSSGCSAMTSRNRRRRRAVRRSVPRGRRDPGRPLHLPSRSRPLSHGDQRLESREGPRLVRARMPTASTSSRATGSTTSPCWPCRAGARASSRSRSPTPRSPRASTRQLEASPARPRSCAAPDTRARTASRSCCAPETRAALWDAVLAAAPAAGLAARDTLRLEACFHLYGNDLMEDRGPIEAGPGLVLQGGDGLRRRRRRARRARRRPAEKLVPFAITGPGIARQDNPVVGGGEVT